MKKQQLKKENLLLRDQTKNHTKNDWKIHFIVNFQ